MAGRPKRKADLKLLNSMPSDQIYALYAAGMSEVNICIKLGIGRYALENWGQIEEHSNNIARARASAADNLACETLDIADSTAPEHAQIARVRIQTRQWLAEKWKPSQYGVQKSTNVQINLSGVRMDALRHVEVLEDLSTTK
jgi:hypothetical protein